MNDDGTMARTNDLIEFSKKHGLKICTVDGLIEYRRKNEKFIQRQVEASLPTEHGDFKMIVYSSKLDDFQHVALIRGKVDGAMPALVHASTPVARLPRTCASFTF